MHFLFLFWLMSTCAMFCNALAGHKFFYVVNDLHQVILLNEMDNT